jgi:hypothetical protein
MPVKNIDPTPFAFALSGLAMSVSILKFRMFDLMPIGREHIFRSMGDALVVIDNKHRLVDCNTVALSTYDLKKNYSCLLFQLTVLLLLYCNNFKKISLCKNWFSTTASYQQHFVALYGNFGISSF